MPFPELVNTVRLVGRRVAPTDLADLHTLQQDPQVMATLGGRLLAEEEVRQQIQRQIAHWETHGFGVWNWRRGSDGAFIGRGGLRFAEISERTEVELLYAIGSQHWRQGYASEIAAAAIDAAFTHLGVDSVAAWTLPNNLASQGVMKRAGLRYERDVTWALLPHVFYHLTREDWLGEKA